jgi:hypothetical protein
MQSCYEDGLEALELMFSRVYMVCGQRLGDKQAQRNLRAQLAELNIKKTAHPLFGDFSLESFVNNALPTPEGVAQNGR